MKKKFIKIFLFIAIVFIAYKYFSLPEKNKTQGRSLDGIEWQEIDKGLAFAELEIEKENILEEKIALFRIDPNEFDFYLEQDTENPKTVQQWAENKQASIVVNGSYFNQENNSLGMLYIDGNSYGVTSSDGSNGYTAMLSIKDGKIRLRYLPETNYDENENIDYGLQTFPTLIVDGQVKIKDDTGQKARRTVLASDRDDNILIIISQYSYFSLYEMANFLQENNLNIHTAINLDGGLSTGLSLNLPDFTYNVASSAVPNVLVVKKTIN